MAGSSANASRILAQENARLGLAIAFGELQRTAGPDTRATATAKALGEDSVHSSNRYVTGVWDTENPSAEPVWLISRPDLSQPFDPALSYENDVQTTTMVGGETLGPERLASYQVEAPTIEVPSTKMAGRTAFWVSDQSVKASLALDAVSGADAESVGGLYPNEIDRLRYAVTERSGLEFIFGFDSDLGEPSVRGLMDRMTALSDFSLFEDLWNPALTAGKGNFHDFTLNSKGLLINPTSGGVKKDLSAEPGLLGPGFAAYMNFPAYLQAPASGNRLVKDQRDLRRLHYMTPPTTFSPSDGEIVHGVSPLITDFGIQFSPHFRSRKPVASMQFVLELWNPYSSGLVEEPLTLEIEGLQPLTMIVRSASDPDNSWETEFNFLDTFGDGEKITIELTRRQLHNGKVPRIEAPAVDAVSHAPGRVLYWLGPDDRKGDRKTASFGHRQSNRMRLELDAVPAGNLPEDFGNDDDVEYRMPATELSVVLRKSSNPSQVLARYEDFNFAGTDTGAVGTVSGWNRRWLTFQFRMTERGHTFLLPGLWLQEIDRRTVTPSFSDLPDPERFTHTVREGTTSSSPGDSSLRNDLRLAQDGKQFYFERILSDSPWSRDSRRDFSLFELPRQPLISVGQLQHLYIHGMSPYSVGNPWGGEEWNRLFDQFFLSGIQEGISVPDFEQAELKVPHPRLSFSGRPPGAVAGLDEASYLSLGEDAGILFEIQGAFNVNSVSPHAWKAVLGGNLFDNFIHAERDPNLHDEENMEYSDVVVDANDFPVGFTRFPQSIQQLFDVDADAMDSDFDRHLMAVKPGLNFLAPRVGIAGDESDYEPEDDGLLTELAEAIAGAVQERIRTKGSPFGSIKAFLTEEFRNGQPVLEAILRGDVDQEEFPRIHSGELRKFYEPFNGGVKEIDSESRTPSWISQADIISAIAPFAVTGGDSFLIRSFGSVFPTGDEEEGSEVWLEALVERKIIPVDASVGFSEYGEDATGFGRSFEVVRFRWLSKSDI